jgi:hypothetical protein
MTPIPLEEDLEKELMKMPHLHDSHEMINKRMNNINTFQCCDGELYLKGTDEYGKDFQICFDAYDFLNWIDTENIEYIKEQLIKNIQKK